MLIDTENLDITGKVRQPDGTMLALSAQENNSAYCGLDCCLTLEIHNRLDEQAVRTGGLNAGIYDFERALQAPYLEIMQRGFAVDAVLRRHEAHQLEVRMAHLQQMLNEFAGAIWDRPLNPRSPAQLQEFFYRQLRLPEVWISQKGIRKLSTNREALEKLDDYLYARPIVSIILRIRELAKQHDFLTIGIDSDQRFRASYNIAGTETGRPSSSENAYGTGGNAQNIAPGLRHVLVADPEHKICVIDLEQVEARDVGFFCGCLFGDWKFLDACESGDLHTVNAKLIWPEKPWTGQMSADRKLAEQIFYREFSFRDMAKRGGHLSNYSGTAFTMARALKIPQKVATEFQDRYCRGPSAAYPCLPRYWQWVGQQIQTVNYITTPFGRTRHFFGRPDDGTTLREAIAFVPQSTTADRMNLGLWRTWRYVPEAQLLAQTYDSITFQYHESLDESELILRVLKLLEIPLFAPSGRRYVVPGEAKIGWNWGPADPKNGRNLEGLIKFNLQKPDTRKRQTGLQRIIP